MSRKLSIFIIVASALLGFVFCVQNAAASAPRTGLVGWWTLDNGDYNSVSKTLYDKSGRGNNATSSNAVSIVPGKIGQAMNFNGTSDCAGITAGSGSVLNLTSAVTISTWAKWTTGGSNGDSYLLEKNDKYAFLEYSVDNGAMTFYIALLSPTSAISTTKPYNDGKWHLYTGTYDQNGGTNNMKLYVDGVLNNQATKTGAITTDTNFFEIGANSTCTAYRWKGSVDDVRVYNRALSAQEVAQLYNASRQNFVNAPVKKQLVGYWTMDKGDYASASKIVYDKSGAGNNGTGVNAANLIPGKINQAINFDGASDGISMTNKNGLDFATATAHSIVAWINTNSSTKAQYIAVDGTAGSYYNYGLALGMLNAGKLVYNNNLGYTNISLNALPTNKWVFVAAVSDGTTVSGYVNGAYSTAGTRSNSGPYAPVTFKIGYSAGSAPYYFSGAIDDVKIYNYALSAAQVSQLYNSSRQKFANAPMRSGLVGYWTMDNGDYKSSSKTVYDKSGFGNNGTSGAAATIVAGKIGQAINLNGSTDYISAGVNVNPYAFGTGPMTVSAWIKTATSAFVMIADNKSAGSNAAGFNLQLSGSTIAFRIANGAAQTTLPGAKNVADNKWHLVAGTRGADGKLRVYADGVLDAGPGADLSSYNITSAQTLYIGAYSSGPGATNFPGSIDDLRIYNRSLSAAEMKQLYSAGRANYVK